MDAVLGHNTKVNEYSSFLLLLIYRQMCYVNKYGRGSSSATVQSETSVPDLGYVKKQACLHK